jgi:hypothetical protein
VAHLMRIYLYVRQFPVDQEVLNRLGHAAEEIISTVGSERFKVPVEVNLNLEEGTLKVVAAVVGTLFSTYYFVGNYKAFKEGVVEICKDANDFGYDFCDKFLNSAGIVKSQVSKQDVKLETPGKLRGLLNDLEKLNDDSLPEELQRQILPSESLRIRLSRAATELQEILTDLSEEEQHAIINSLKFESLPAVSQWPREKKEIEPPRLARESVPEIEYKPGAVKVRTIRRKRPRYKKKLSVRPKKRLR